MPNLPSLSEWRTQALRLTAFTSLDTNPENFLHWEQLVGEQPQKKTTQPRSGIIDEDGPFENGNLAMHVEPGRIDWRYHPILSLSKVTLEGIPSIGPLPQAIDELKKLMMRWLDSAPTLTRLAFGAELYMEVEDHEAAYRLLNEYLPDVTVDPKSSDFQYAINRKRMSRSGIEELVINRLSRWRALQVSMTVNGHGSPPVKAAKPYYVCSVDIDINTVPNLKRNLPNEMLRLLFNELVDLGLEIAERGDIA